MHLVHFADLVHLKHLVHFVHFAHFMHSVHFVHSVHFMHFFVHSSTAHACTIARLAHVCEESVNYHTLCTFVKVLAAAKRQSGYKLAQVSRCHCSSMALTWTKF